MMLTSNSSWVTIFLRWSRLVPRSASCPEFISISESSLALRSLYLATSSSKQWRTPTLSTPRGCPGSATMLTVLPRVRTSSSLDSSKQFSRWIFSSRLYTLSLSLGSGSLDSLEPSFGVGSGRLGVEGTDGVFWHFWTVVSRDCLSLWKPGLLDTEGFCPPRLNLSNEGFLGLVFSDRVTGGSHCPAGGDSKKLSLNAESLGLSLLSEEMLVGWNVSKVFTSLVRSTDWICCSGYSFKLS